MAADGEPLPEPRLDVTAALIHSVASIVRLHFFASPPNVATTFEALNALGVVAGIVLAGASVAPPAMEHFNAALNGQIKASMMEGCAGHG